MIERCAPASHLRIAVPCYTGEIKADTARSLVMATAALKMSGIAWSLDIEQGCCYIDHARNMLATRFYNDKSATDLLFIDADIAFAPVTAVQLALSRRPFIAGIYPKKADIPAWPVSFDTDELWADEDGYLEAAMVPTGFLRLNRAVFDELMPGTVRYTTDGPDTWFAWFESGVRGGVYVGEDPFLCRQWRRLGGKIHMIPDMTFNHIGPKAWEGNWAHWMREQA